MGEGVGGRGCMNYGGKISEEKKKKKEKIYTYSLISLNHPIFAASEGKGRCVACFAFSRCSRELLDYLTGMEI